MNDITLLKLAVALAAKSTEPNGCGSIIVLDGNIIAEEFNSQRADNIAVNHAEIKAIVAANKKLGTRKLTGATAYCSCEPCAMCLTALSYAKVERIVFHQTMYDLSPNDPQSQLDPYAFAASLNFAPTLQHVPRLDD